MTQASSKAIAVLAQRLDPEELAHTVSDRATTKALDAVLARIDAAQLGARLSASAAEQAAARALDAVASKVDREALAKRVSEQIAAAGRRARSRGSTRPASRRRRRRARSTRRRARP